MNVVPSVSRHVLVDNLTHLIELSEFRGKAVLELGAGCSLYLPLFLEAGASKLVANDLLEKRLALSRIEDARYVEVVGDFLEVHIPSNEFDIVFSHLTLM